MANVSKSYIPKMMEEWTEIYASNQYDKTTY